MAKTRAKRTPAEERKHEIRQAGLKLYREVGFEAFSFNELAKRLPFARSLIYYYYKTKEEVFVDLMKEEYVSWTEQMMELSKAGRLTPKEFASRLADTLVNRRFFLQLLSMNHFDLETNCRLENLVELKKAYLASFSAFEEAVVSCIEGKDKEDAGHISRSFFPFILGIYPYAYPTNLQKEAMRVAGYTGEIPSVRDLIETLILTILEN